ncbi:MAG TPA: perosamine synthetase [Verrucomicrobia bacterium]|nr:perosamine synthetase [Verrucomicrobiota bacterium]
MKKPIRIPVYQPDLSGNEKKYVIECLDSTWISSKGEFLQKFERRFAEATGVKRATAVSNGTVAIHLALLALGVGPGDEVIVPSLTYVASVNPILYVGAKPVFVDSLPGTWQMDPEDVRRKITPRTRAIIAVHLYGHPCDMDPIMHIVREHRLLLLEDCAEAMGSRYHGQHVGSFGHMAAYSFFGNKTVTTGEGGMVVTNDETLHDRALHFKGQGLARDREYWHDVVGYNYRMTNICAAIGLAQLERLDAILERKRKVARGYREALAGLPVALHAESPGVFHSYWMCSILVDNPDDRDPLREALLDAGIETRPVFYPVHTMPMYAGHFDSHPVAEDIARRGMNLPSWPNLGQEQIKEIAGIVAKYYQRG